MTNRPLRQGDEAHDAGRAARLAGQPITAAPAVNATVAGSLGVHLDWRSGWRAAEAELQTQPDLFAGHAAQEATQ